MPGHRQIQVTSQDGARFGFPGPEEHQRPERETVVVPDILALVVVVDGDGPAAGLPGFLHQAIRGIAAVKHHRIEIALGKHPVKKAEVPMHPPCQQVQEFPETGFLIGDGNRPDRRRQALCHLPVLDRIQQGHLIGQGRESVDEATGAEDASPVSMQIVICNEQHFHLTVYICFHSR